MAWLCIHQDRRKSRSLDNDIPHRSWQVLLLGGPSGVGKTSVSYRLAHHFKIGITEVDDFQVILERMTTPTEQPVLHYWRTHPEAGNLPAEEIVKHTIAVGQVMAPALEAVIANHIESRAPLVLEGDFILPMRATSFSESSIQSQVRTLFLYEESEEQFRHNFLQREPEHGLQEKRAQVSWLYGQWLRREAERVGALTVPARPWSDLFERILIALK
jgi:2-phosphoglycerate kinase